MEVDVREVERTIGTEAINEILEKKFQCHFCNKLFISEQKLKGKVKFIKSPKKLKFYKLCYQVFHKVFYKVFHKVFYKVFL